MDNRDRCVKCPLYVFFGHNCKTEKEREEKKVTIKCRKNSKYNYNVMRFNSVEERNKHANTYCKCFYEECPEYISRMALKNL